MLRVERGAWDSVLEVDRDMRILIVEDQLKLAKLVRQGLREEGLAVDVAVNGEDALWMAGATEYDADRPRRRCCPGIDGFEVCRRLRADAVWSPILMLTARDAVDDRVTGLDTGADDYLVKPFEFDELVARIRAITRRGVTERPTDARGRRPPPGSGPRRRVARGYARSRLSRREFAMLETFMRRPGDVLSRFHLLEHVWDGDYENRSNVVDVYVRYLREKIDVPFGLDSIETVRGSGYRLRVPRRA